MARILKTIFQLRRGIAADWGRVNPVLEAGEPGFAIDTHDLRIGNGVDHWNDLPSISSQKQFKTYATHLEFPVRGNAETIYIATEEKKLYQWNEELFQYESLSGSDEEARGLIQTISNKVDTLIGAIAGDNRKSVRQIANEEVERVIDGAIPEFDTLREIAEWIMSHPDIAEVEQRITTLEGLSAIFDSKLILGEVSPGIQYATVKDYVESIENKIQEQIGDEDAPASDSILGRLISLEAYNQEFTEDYQDMLDWWSTSYDDGTLNLKSGDAENDI